MAGRSIHGSHDQSLSLISLRAETHDETEEHAWRHIAQTHTKAHTHTYTHTKAYIHTHTHTHIHT